MTLGRYTTQIFKQPPHITLARMPSNSKGTEAHATAAYPHPAGKKKARTYAAPKPPKEDGGDDRACLNKQTLKLVVK